MDAALEAGFRCGGWCPTGRQAEDGIIPDRYPVTELPGGGYRERTRQNVEDSGGTVLIHCGDITGGTVDTLAFCLQGGKPFKLLDAEWTEPERAAAVLLDFVNRRGIAVLNVAGPRQSQWPEAADFTRAVVSVLLRRQG